MELLDAAKSSKYMTFKTQTMAAHQRFFACALFDDTGRKEKEKEKENQKFSLKKPPLVHTNISLLCSSPLLP